jgi:hypothetical protein
MMTWVEGAEEEEKYKKKESGKNDYGKESG